MGFVLGLDIGSRRVGVALASLETRLPRPLTTLAANDQLVENLKSLIDSQSVKALVVGLPRGLSGQETSQTENVRKTAAELKSELNLPLYFQDEAVTSIKARAELTKRGKPYSRSQIDSLAAVYILEDFLSQNRAV